MANMQLNLSDQQIDRWLEECKELLEPQTVLLRWRGLRGLSYLWRWPDTSSRSGIRRTWVRLEIRLRRRLDGQKVFSPWWRGGQR